MAHAFNQQGLNQRRAGVLLHVTSLPKGDLGEDAFRFVDFLAKTGATVWQTLPLNMPHGDGSPYQCLSAHAGNPALISLEALQELGWLAEWDFRSTLDREGILRRAFANFNQLNIQHAQADFLRFCQRQSHWLDDFALFMAIRKQHQCVCWHDWPADLMLREPEAIRKAHNDFAEEIAFIKFTQHLFFEQWHALKAYANNQNIALFGDIPIFISYDSADVWAQPALFKLDEHLNMTVVAGVPPDYFSETGQRWGNPHYRWDLMQADGFQWWLARMRTQNAMFDMVRIDHFRGLEAAWEIPANEPTAIQGEWVKAPGEALLQAIKKHLPLVTLVAEDLGVITPEVDALREAFHLPGMKILQFAFDGSPDNPYLPERIRENSVIYTGTHDNDTTLGWFLSLTPEQKQPFYDYMQAHLDLDESAIQMPLTLIELALASKACLAIIPMQDILCLDGAHRMNTPGTIENNWQWRFDWSQLSAEMEAAFMQSVQKHHRNPAIKGAL
jgi:4-alpha-glucanotransferase